jgi:stage IV sporulation protein FB
VGRIHLGSILGTTIELDFSFIFLVALWVLTDMERGVKYALLWIPILLLSVLFHEFAHASMIGAFGFGPSRIVLQGIGGVTINERRARPWQDLIISAVGPLSSFILAALVWLALVRIPRVQQDPFFQALLPLMAKVNVIWGILNLMPVMPLDGYNAFRHFLRLFLDERVSFLIAIWTSMIVGGLLAGLAIYARDPFVALLFIWFVRSSYLQWQFFRSFKRSDE